MRFWTASVGMRDEPEAPKVMGLSLSFAPLIPWTWLLGLCGLGTVLLAWMLFRGISGAFLRAIVLAGLAIVLANPSLLQEERESLDDVVLLMLDKSSSMLVADREKLFSTVEQHLNQELAARENLQIHIAVFSDRTNDIADKGTRFQESLTQALAELPTSRLSAVIALTDGQVHDLPTSPDEEDANRLGIPEGTPFHVVLVGQDQEYDRVLSVQSAPRYGLVGENTLAAIRVDDLGFAESGLAQAATVPVEVLINGEVYGRADFPVGRDLEIELPIRTAGRNLFEVRAVGVEGELSSKNNSLVLQVNGVRERLSVLLVSGQPHQSERAWRNLLKSDPSVDLVHFTILRPTEKRDNTPIFELSLIPFPINELFVDKLDDFDLIIFDQYPRRGILPGNYFANIARYVQNGGALFVSAGPEFARTRTIYATALASVIPGAPTGVIKQQPYVPSVSPLGQRHPITNSLSAPIARGSESEAQPDDQEKSSAWGPWVRQIEVEADDAQVLMQGADKDPLLLAARRGEGRVVLLASDNLWLWARGFQGGGPSTEVLRRSAHWLMGEPELEEEQLVATARNGKILIERQSLGVGDAEVELTFPSGRTEKIALVDQADGKATAEINVDEKGIFNLADDALQTRVAVGTLNPKELKDLRSSAETLAPLVAATNGSLRNAQYGLPKIRHMREARSYSGQDWVGIRKHQATRLVGLKTLSLTPALLALLALAGFLLWSWWREGR